MLLIFPGGSRAEMLPSYTEAVERVLPIVVNIGIASDDSQDSLGDTHAGHDHGPLPSDAAELQGAGAGFILSGDGLVVTCNHVIGNSDIIAIQLHEGPLVQGTRDKMVVGVDADADIALLRIPAEFLPEVVPVATLGDSDSVKVGQPTFAIGHPQGFPFTATFGHISGLGRTNLNFGKDVQILDQDFIQHQTYISPGSSGGPLLSEEGEVIGLNVGVNKANNAIAFAIPINQVRPVVESLRKHGRFVYPDLGITGVPALSAAERRALKVVDVRPRSSAAEGGVQQQDLILELAGEPIRNQVDLWRAQRRLAPDTVVELSVQRGDEIVLCRVTPRLPTPLAQLDRAAPLPPPILNWRGWIFAEEGGRVVVQSPSRQDAEGLGKGWIVDALEGESIASLKDFFVQLEKHNGWRESCVLTVRPEAGGDVQLVRM